MVLFGVGRTTGGQDMGAGRRMADVLTAAFLAACVWCFLLGLRASREPSSTRAVFDSAHPDPAVHSTKETFAVFFILNGLMLLPLVALRSPQLDLDARRFFIIMELLLISAVYVMSLRLMFGNSFLALLGLIAASATVVAIFVFLLR